MEIPDRNTIFLKGLFFSQVRTLEERMIEENIAQEDRSASTADHRSDLRLSDIRVTRFRSKKQWAEAYKEVTLKCWYCGLSFKGLPCFIPRQIRNTPAGKEFDTFGLFCGFACAYSFLNSQAEFIKNNSHHDKLIMLEMLFSEFYNRRVSEFREAPYLYDLTLYGGHVDIMDYKNNLRNINASMFQEAKVKNP